MNVEDIMSWLFKCSNHREGERGRGAVPIKIENGINKQSSNFNSSWHVTRFDSG